MQHRPWFLGEHVDKPLARLFCFPYAGGNAAAFVAWTRFLPAGCDLCAVQLPGRANRLKDRAFHDMPRMISALVDAVQPHLDLPAIFFGHSLGAILAFELARRLADRPALRHLVVSGCRAPANWPSPKSKALAALEGGQFLDALKAHEGVSKEMAKNDALLRFFLPILKADFDVVASYRYAAGEALDMPLTVLGGRGDRLTPAESLAAWQSECRRPIALHLFDGDHFFIEQQRNAVLSLLARIFRQAVSGEEPRPP
ncbi:MAG TPA: alpha/beta fold hydrolase [Stellaceae bacterium]|nr:alpha/beta fold hydrolase [Stellaceae bacterium]